jgi:tetratricopeptide (TPR) repeat protein
MKKDNVMFGVIGLLLGLIVGFIATNWMNKSVVGTAPVTTAGGTDLSGASNSQLPPNHPPIGSNAGGSAPKGAPLVDCNANPPGHASRKKNAQYKTQDYEAQMKGADVLYQGQCFEDSAKFYEAAAKLKPTEKEPLVKAGNAYFDGEKYQDAEKWYTQALAKDPKDINVRTDLGLTFFLREPRDIDRAIKEYKASLAMDPKHEITLQNLALAYKEKNDTANYQSTLNELKAINPQNPIFTKLDQK